MGFFAPLILSLLLWHPSHPMEEEGEGITDDFLQILLSQQRKVLELLEGIQNKQEERLPDPCELGTHNCSELANCTSSSLDGGYLCTCQDGYSGDGFTCQDPCTEGVHNCSELANCTSSSSDSSYLCTCQHGYIGDGFTCRDIDECRTREHQCEKETFCVNTIGNYTCQRYDEFRFGSDVDGPRCPGDFRYIDELGCVLGVEVWLSWSEAEANCYKNYSSRLLEYSSLYQFSMLAERFIYIPRNLWVGLKGLKWQRSGRRPAEKLWRPSEPDTSRSCGYVWLRDGDPGLGLASCDQDYLDGSLCQLLED